MVALALLAGCSGRADTAAAGPGASAPAPGAAAASAPPVGVTTVAAQQRDLPRLLATTGTVTALTSVDVKAQVSSQVTAVHVREGQFVRGGELLFTLDARTDEANVAKARAQLVRDEAGLADARRQLARSRELLAQNFVSQGAVDTNLAQVEAQAALLASDRAALDAARVALSYARIVAPGAGRVGVIGVYPGSAVQALQTTLVTITQLDPIAVAFSLPQSRLPEALAALKGRGSAVSATLPEGGGTVRGRLQFVDNSVDASTGTVKVKAQFDNSDGRLWPGAYVNVEMTAGVLEAAVIVPQAAIIRSARGTLVYAVQDGKAVARPVQLVYAQGDDAAVTAVQPGERIVLDGRQNLRPGTPVFARAGAAPGRPASASGSGGLAASGTVPRPPAP
jgi:RND family efflux transporter MFP subunit